MPNFDRATEFCIKGNSLIIRAQTDDVALRDCVGWFIKGAELNESTCLHRLLEVLKDESCHRRLGKGMMIRVCQIIIDNYPSEQKCRPGRKPVNGTAAGVFKTGEGRGGRSQPTGPSELAHTVLKKIQRLSS